ncbi:hypothetical protein LSH36_750g01001 [Paralvinella palmiformis]|uniref:Uncharacterized protein n=1 Tax=Paralvinella palmiformis TaxID=53620 RepID=A0AAD9MT61_9ANNE|nr:hypothetical protein LSH36_750g01001 [Paralvinella palmiformis]
MAGRFPTKFVQSPNPHLICAICGQLFEEPVINVMCGHTFCKRCIYDKSEDGKTAKCPLEGQICQLETLVLNRSVKSQIDDLDIFCCHGLRWSDSESDYVCDPDGCNEKLKYSSRKDHEDSCQFSLVPCPNNAVHCGKIRRKKLADHIRVCQHHPCNFKYKGCMYTGTSDDIITHVTLCAFRTLPDEGIDNKKQIQNLVSENNKLQHNINKLISRMAELEQDKNRMMSQLEKNNREMTELKMEQKKLGDKVDKLLALKSSPSSSQTSSSSSSASSNNTKVGSILNRISSSPTGAAPSQRNADVWMMPFQFKCFGTLRSHQGGVWALKTHKNLLFSAGGDHVIKVWNLEQLERGCKHTMTGHTDKIQSLAVGKYLYSGGADRSIRAWNLKDFTEVIVKEDMLYSGSHNTIDIWHTKDDFTLRGKISHTFGSVYALAITELYIIVGTYNNNTHLFDVQTQVHVHKLSGHVGAIQSLAVNKTGTFLFTASTDANIQLWSLENYLPIQSLSRHEASVNHVIIHNDLVLSGSEDTEIKLFKYFKMQMGFMPS